MRYFLLALLYFNCTILISQRIFFATIEANDSIIKIRVRGDKPPIYISRIEYSFLKDSSNTLDINMYFQGCNFAAFSMPLDTIFCVPNNLPFDLKITTIRDTLFGCPSPTVPLTIFTFFKTYSQLVGLSDNDFSSIIHLYPNPTKENLILDFGDFDGEKAIQVFDLQGRKVKEEIKSIESKVELNVSILPKGMYLLEINTNKGVLRRRFEVMD